MTATLRHRHPDYPANRCGVNVVVREDGKFQQFGQVRRKCANCKLRLRQEDLR